MPASPAHVLAMVPCMLLLLITSWRLPVSSGVCESVGIGG